MVNSDDFDRALELFEFMCKTLDKANWLYVKGDGLVINCGAKGKDLPMPVSIEIDEKRKQIVLVSVIPIMTPKEKLADMALALCAVNHSLLTGNFEMDLDGGNVLFRMVNSYEDSDIGEQVFLNMLFPALNCVETYNDKFLELSLGNISVESFFEEE